MTYSWDKELKPIPMLQWLVVIVLSAHVLVTSPQPLGVGGAGVFVLVMLAVNLGLLYGLPRVIPLNALATTLVLIDTLLVPATLYATGTTRTDLYVVYFGIILIAGASGSLKRALALAAMICVAYGIFTLWDEDTGTNLETVLLRWPFFLVMTMFYGALAEYTRRVREDKEKMTYAATHDDLTGMPNRRLVLESLARELDRAKRFRTPVSCALLDLDGFKSINDVYGHDMGDHVLQDFASLLALQTRGYDLTGRLGGDEFVWILPDVSEEHCKAPAEGLREAVEKYEFGSGTSKFRVTTSIGITTYAPGDTYHPTPGEMLKAADVALYMAKKHGGNRVTHLPLLERKTVEPVKAGDE